MKIWAVEAKYKLANGKKVKQLLCKGQPYHICEDSAKAWSYAYQNDNVKFKVVSITRRFE